jgi:Fe2+ transport system protein FeoA
VSDARRTERAEVVALDAGDGGETGRRRELLHEGLFGRDPIALKVDDMRVALRRREAASLIIRRVAA